MRTGVDIKAADEQRERLEAITDGGGKRKYARRARIILLTDDGLRTIVIMACSDALKPMV